MTSYANRIRQLREQSGRSPVEVALAVGINLPWYYDVEAHDDETTTVLSLRQLHLLACALGVTVRQLLATGDDYVNVPPQRLSLWDLSSRLRSRTDAEGIGAVEDAVGWRLDHFLANPASAWDEPVEFLRFICEFLGLDWLDVVPNGPLGER